MIEFSEITDVNDTAFEQAIQIYLTSFPDGEIQPVNLVAERVSKGLSKLYVGRRHGEVALMALLWPLKGTDFILLDYLATKAAYRGLGLGSLFLQEMGLVLSRRHQYFIIEVDDPAYGSDREIRQRRVNYYQRNGAKLLKGVNYILPPIQKELPMPMQLLVLPEYNGAKMDAGLVKTLITRIYQELYFRGEDDPLLNSFIHTIPDPVALI
jgi:GNAT superfamily N-acetyltransferase